MNPINLRQPYRSTLATSRTTTPSDVTDRASSALLPNRKPDTHLGITIRWRVQLADDVAATARGRLPC